MAGTKAGGQQAVKTIKAARGDNWYRLIGAKGAKGGKNSKTGGFGQGELGKARARIYGSIGGKISKRSPHLNDCNCLVHTQSGRKAKRETNEPS